MEPILIDGYCPECQLKNEGVELMLNKDDFWECPKSNLQLAVLGLGAVTLKFRGIGKFKEEPEYGTQNIDGAALTYSQGENYYSDISIFISQDEFKSYLLNEVEPQLEFSLENLADTFAKFQFGNPFTNENSKLPYKRQSKYFKIDFENNSIIKKLEERDSHEGMPSPKSYTHLYSFLISLFKNYYDGDATWLPAMGMSLNQLDLCNKHLRHGPEPITNIKDVEIIKKRLLTLIVDLIEIIYLDKPIELKLPRGKTITKTAPGSSITSFLTLQEVLNLKTDLFKNSKVKLVRHKDNRKEYRELIRDKETLLDYQKEQSKEVFKDCDYIISFIGQEGTKSLLFGIFKVNDVNKGEKYFYYDLERVHDLDFLVDRIIVDWGNNAISWHQWYHKQPKEIIQILPKGYLGSFPGLLNFVLEFDELQKLIDNPDANQDWQNHLSAVNGIYLILDSKTGNQYIGSAYGGNGIWQRWSSYVKNYHGGNKRLVEICDAEPGYHKYFRFSILQSLPSNMHDYEVIAIESLYKQKLGTRAYGLNAN